jgi:hypothetical protein
MNTSAHKGNAPEAWTRLLEVLDEKLQLGLLDKVKRVHSYHVEDGTLFIEAGSVADRDYLCKEAVHQQLRLFAEDIFRVRAVKVNAPEI